MAESNAWVQGIEDFGISQYGETGFSMHELIYPRAEDEAPPEPRPRRVSTARRNLLEKRCVEGIVPRHISRLDFIQAIAGAEEDELTTIMCIAFDIVVRECHKDRVIGGDVDSALYVLLRKCREFCVMCGKLKMWVRRKEERMLQRLEDKDKEEGARREKKRKRTRAILMGRIDTKTQGGGVGVSFDSGILRDVVQSTEQKEYEELLEAFGSDLCLDIGRLPEDIYQDTKNIRIGTILCMIAKSKALQRLVCVGKFYAESLGHEYKYAVISKDSLEEFLVLTEILRNAFMTQQTSPGDFVKCIQNMVIRGGVHGFVHDVLCTARNLETERLMIETMV